LQGPGRQAKISGDEKYMARDYKNNDDETDLVASLGRTLAKPDLSNVLGGLGEIALDQVLQDGVVKNIPIFGTVIGFAKAGLALRDRLFLKKVLLFLDPIASVSPEKRVRFLEKVSADDDYRQRVGDNLVLWLDSLDEFQQATWLGRAFRAMVAGEIERSEFLALGAAIRRVDTTAIPDLVRFYETHSAPEEARQPDSPWLDLLQRSAIAGLVRFRFGHGGFGGGHQGRYERNDLGHLFLRKVLGRETPTASREV
jgi:hypothetical protein